jgi:DNA polymerase-3 subunit delta'
VLCLLARAVRRDSLPPSLILAGPEGVGKCRVATALAQVVNCPRPVLAPATPSDAAAESVAGSAGAAGVFEVDACGECAVCRRIERGNYADVISVGIQPDAASIKTDQAREVIAKAAYRPYEGRKRVIIIDPADALEIVAQNALLKTLEETPPTSMFLLVSSRPDALLATVRSRCPRIRFGPLAIAEITEVLRRERGLSEREARAAAVVSGGSVLRALDAVSEEAADVRSQALAALRGVVAAGTSRAEAFERVKAALGSEQKHAKPAREREELAMSLGALSSLVRDLTALEAGGRTAEIANADLIEDLEPLVGSFGRARLMRAFAAVERALSAIHGNANPRIVVDWLAFQL